VETAVARREQLRIQSGGNRREDRRDEGAAREKRAKVVASPLEDCTRRSPKRKTPRNDDSAKN
jgi:hypothetical protein